jgi:hypothetical protein
MIVAHGIGGRGDLPVPFSLALTGAVAALVLSFVILAFAWKSPRYANGAERGVALPQGFTRTVDSRAFRIALKVIGLLVTGFFAVAAILGPDLLVNPTFGAVYVLFWVGIVPASILLGPIWRYLNPLRTLHELLAVLLRMRPEEGLAKLPAWLGYWPAAIGLFAFVWLELVAPGNVTLPVVRLWFALYAGVHFVAAAVFGSRWFDRGDAFEVYSAMFARLSPWGRRASDRRLVLRNPLANLDGVPIGPGLVAVVAVMLGSTAFDGFSTSPAWIGFVQNAANGTLLSTGVLVGFVLLVAGTFWAATVIAGGLSGSHDRRMLPGQFAGSVIPIALGYVIAHYFTLFVVEGQRTLIYAADPLSNGANLLGLADNGVNTAIADNPGVVAIVKVSAVVVGHVLGVIAAHDRAVALFPRRTALLGQLPLLMVMVGYTLGGLTLLFAT